MAGAPTRPNGIIGNSYFPNSVMYAVFSTEFMATGTWQYPLERYRVDVFSCVARQFIKSSLRIR